MRIACFKYWRAQNPAKTGGGGHWKGLSLFRSRFMAAKMVVFSRFFPPLRTESKDEIHWVGPVFFSWWGPTLFFSACVIPIFDCELHGFESLFRRCLLGKKPPVFKKMGKKSNSINIPLAIKKIHQSINQPTNQPITLPETNIFAPKNWWLEYYFPIGFRPIFRGYVSFREGNQPSNSIQTNQFNSIQFNSSQIRGKVLSATLSCWASCAAWLKVGPCRIWICRALRMRSGLLWRHGWLVSWRIPGLVSG